MNCLTLIMPLYPGQEISGSDGVGAFLDFHWHYVLLLLGADGGIREERKRLSQRIYVPDCFGSDAGELMAVFIIFAKIVKTYWPEISGWISNVF